MTTGERIKAARKRVGLTQTQLGEILGVSGSMIAQYETDNRNPKIEALQRIAAALGQDVSALLPERLAETYEVLAPISDQLIALNKAILKQGYPGYDYFYFYGENDNRGQILPKESPISIDGLRKTQEIRDYLRIIEVYCPELRIQELEKVAALVQEIAKNTNLPSQECKEYLFSAWITNMKRKIEGQTSQTLSAGEETKHGTETEESAPPTTPDDE